jgi:hypothetical protein
VRRTQYENGKSCSVDRSARGKRQHPLGAIDLEQPSRVELHSDADATVHWRGDRTAMQGVAGTAALVSRAENFIENTGYLV